MSIIFIFFFFKNLIFIGLLPVVEDINGKFQGGRVKVVGIPGGITPKNKEKTWISRGGGGSMQKKWKILGGHG